MGKDEVELDNARQTSLAASVFQDGAKATRVKASGKAEKGAGDKSKAKRRTRKRTKNKKSSEDDQFDSVKLYLKRIGKVHLLNRADEVEIAKRMEVPVAEVTNLMQVSEENISISAMIDEEHDFHLSDKLEQEIIPSADLVLLKNSLKHLLRNALTELDAKEEKVIRLRFGLDGTDPKTLKEIGEMMSLSRERIRQIEAQALDKLHRSQKCQQLRGYLN